MCLKVKNIHASNNNYDYRITEIIIVVIKWENVISFLSFL